MNHRLLSSQLSACVFSRSLGGRSARRSLLCALLFCLRPQLGADLSLSPVGESGISQITGLPFLSGLVPVLLLHNATFFVHPWPPMVGRRISAFFFALYFSFAFQPLVSACLSRFTTKTCGMQEGDTG